MFYGAKAKASHILRVIEDCLEKIMDFGQEYFEMYDKMRDEKVPFYMTYPMRNTFLEEAEYERDCRRFQEIYPKDARRVQELVNRECDKMEYEGSLMFDEYPDRFMLRLISRRIYQELEEKKDDEMMRMDRNDPLCQMIDVMLLHEIFRRRCRYRRCHRWY